MRSVDDAIGFLAQDPMHATAQAKRHAGQLPAAAEEFIESTLFYKKNDSTNKVESNWFACFKWSSNLFAKTKHKTPLIQMLPKNYWHKTPLTQMLPLRDTWFNYLLLLSSFIVLKNGWFLLNQIPTHKVEFFGFPSCMEQWPSSMGHLTNKDVMWPILNQRLNQRLIQIVRLLVWA